MQTWELWYPDAAATGLLFARGRLDPTTVLWVHAAPDNMAVTVRNDDDSVVVNPDQLRLRGERFPMTRLEISGQALRREDRWPNTADLGSLVILSGGEVGRLVEWWNEPDGSAWRWRIELSNRRTMPN